MAQYGSSREGVEKEMRLWDSGRERRHTEDLADMFSLITTLEHVENAYIRGAVENKKYETVCQRLLGKYKVAEGSLSGDPSYPSLREFMDTYKMDCPKARARIEIGAPATVVSQHSDDRSTAIVIAETVQNFITCADSLKLNVRAVDELQPYVTDLLSSMNRIPTLPDSFEAKPKVQMWLKTMNAMKASDELSEDQARQLLFDVEQGYSQFMSVLQGNK